MSQSQLQQIIDKLLEDNPRFKLEAYQFVREALSYAQEQMGMGESPPEPDELDELEEAAETESHLTGQQLCEAIRQYAIEQYGFLAKVVLNSWGVHTTSDFGELVYNMISVGLMKKSESDQRKDFDDVYEFDQVFQEQFEITMPE